MFRWLRHFFDVRCQAFLVTISEIRTETCFDLSARALCWSQSMRREAIRADRVSERKPRSASIFVGEGEWDAEEVS